MFLLIGVSQINLVSGQLLPPKNNFEGLYWLERSAEGGDANAQFRLAKVFESGLKGRADFGNALRMYTKAALQNHLESQMWLAHSYYEGVRIKRDLVQSLQWYQRAAMQGHPLAQFNYAVMLETGSGISRNLGEAAIYYEKAARQGHLPSQINLAMLYARGGGVKPDIKWAMIWLHVAITGGGSIPSNVYDNLQLALAPVERDEVKKKALLLFQQILNK